MFRKGNGQRGGGKRTDMEKRKGVRVRKRMIGKIYRLGGEKGGAQERWDNILESIREVASELDMIRKKKGREEDRERRLECKKHVHGRLSRNG